MSNQDQNDPIFYIFVPTELKYFVFVIFVCLSHTFGSLLEHGRKIIFSLKLPVTLLRKLKGQRSNIKVTGNENVKIFSSHKSSSKVTKSVSIYVKPRPRWWATHSTHIIEYISSAEMIRLCANMCYPGEQHVAAATRPCTYLYFTMLRFSSPLKPRLIRLLFSLTCQSDGAKNIGARRWAESLPRWRITLVLSISGRKPILAAQGPVATFDDPHRAMYLNAWLSIHGAVSYI